MDGPGKAVREYTAHRGMKKEDAAIFGAELEKLGQFTAADVVAAARPEGSPLHRFFEWDDAKAGELYREELARYYIRAVEVVVRDVPTHAFLAPRVVIDGYASVEAISESVEMVDALKSRALSYLRTWKRNYGAIDQFSVAAAFIDRAIAELDPPPSVMALMNRIEGRRGRRSVS
jgi:hypothetical protein